jgi:hypothetical protein
VAPHIVDDGVSEYDRSFIHLQMGFGNSVAMDKWGAPRGGDVYWFRYKPADAIPSARDWTKRLEALLSAQ